MSISKQDILRALGSAEFMHGHLVDSQPSDDGGGDLAMTPESGSHEKREDRLAMSVDNLFKKSKKEQSQGILKVKFLGNAMKDYQLIRLVGDGPKTPTGNLVSGKALNQPMFVCFTRARRALVDPWID